jgi:hypothetical protein
VIREIVGRLNAEAGSVVNLHGRKIKGEEGGWWGEARSILVGCACVSFLLYFSVPLSWMGLWSWLRIFQQAYLFQLSNHFSAESHRSRAGSRVQAGKRNYQDAWKRLPPITPDHTQNPFKNMYINRFKPRVYV